MCLLQFWFPQGVCLGVDLLGHMVVVFPSFFKESLPSSRGTLIFCRLSDDGHSDRCEVVSHCGFDLHFCIN